MILLSVTTALIREVFRLRGLLFDQLPELEQQPELEPQPDPVELTEDTQDLGPNEVQREVEDLRPLRTREDPGNPIRRRPGRGNPRGMAEPWPEVVWRTQRGSRTHVFRDCRALRNARPEAQNMCRLCLFRLG